MEVTIWKSTDSPHFIQFLQWPFENMTVLNKGAYNLYPKLRLLQHSCTPVMKIWALGSPPILTTDCRDSATPHLPFSSPLSQLPTWPISICKAAAALDTWTCSPFHHVQEASTSDRTSSAWKLLQLALVFLQLLTGICNWCEVWPSYKNHSDHSASRCHSHDHSEI